MLTQSSWKTTNKIMQNEHILKTIEELAALELRRDVAITALRSIDSKVSLDEIVTVVFKAVCNDE